MRRPPRRGDGVPKPTRPYEWRRPHWRGELSRPRVWKAAKVSEGGRRLRQSTAGPVRSGGEDGRARALLAVELREPPVTKQGACRSPIDGGGLFPLPV